MISKYRNFSSYNFIPYQYFLHGHILFYLDNPDERETISNPNKSKYPAGLDSKTRILCATAFRCAETKTREIR